MAEEKTLSASVRADGNVIERVLVLGATGKTGRLVVAGLLKAGKHVTCLVREATARRGGFPWPADAVTVITGDVTDAATIGLAVRGAGAVINTLGHYMGEVSNDFMTTTVRHVLAAMQREGCTRLLDMTGVVNQVPGESRPIFYSAMWLYLRLLKNSVLEDHAAKTEVIRSAGDWLEWTIARPPVLTDGPLTGTYHKIISAGASCTLTISRADVADFLVRELGERKFIRQLPIICAA